MLNVRGATTADSVLSSIVSLCDGTVISLIHTADLGFGVYRGFCLLSINTKQLYCNHSMREIMFWMIGDITVGFRGCWGWGPELDLGCGLKIAVM